MAFPTGWAYKCRLVQDHTKVGTGTQSDFPSLFVWTGSSGTSNLPQEIFTSGVGAKSDGSDIRFTSDRKGTTELPFEIVAITNTGTPGTSSAEIWVKIPSVNSITDVVAYVWWGKSDATAYGPTDTYGSNNVWMTSYKAVYHGDGSGDLADSTSNGYTATNSGTTSTTGKIGKARSCDGLSQYASRSDNQGITNDNVTESLWFNAVNTTDSDDHSALISHYDDTAKIDYRIFQYTTGIGVARHAPAVAWNSTSETAISAGTWYKADLVYSGTTLSFYLNGSFQRSVTVSSSGSGTYTTQLVIGRGTATAQTYFYGSLDEIRISNIARSAEWLSTDYNNQNSPQTFWSVGTVNSIIFPTGWKYRCLLTQDHTKVGTGTQSNFTTPFIWTGTAGTSNLPSQIFASNGGANSDGSDIRFTSGAAGTTELPFEIVSFSKSGNGSAEIWVKVSSVNSSTDTIIYVWWGKSDAIAYLPSETYGQYGVWDSTSHEAVYHMKTASACADSTSYARNCITATSWPTLIDGKLGKAFQFNVSGQAITPPVSVLNTTIVSGGKITIGLWNYGGPTQPMQGTLFGAISAGPARQLNVHCPWGDDQNIYWDCAGNYDRINILDNDSSHWKGQWNYWVFTKDVAAGTMRIYRNGSQIQSDTGKTKAFGTITDFEMGIYPGGSFSYDGSIDEFRVSSIERSAAWVLTDYNSQNSPQTFWSVGAITTLGGSFFVFF